MPVPNGPVRVRVGLGLFALPRLSLSLSREPDSEFKLGIVIRVQSSLKLRLHPAARVNFFLRELRQARMMLRM